MASVRTMAFFVRRAALGLLAGSTTTAAMCAATESSSRASSRAAERARLQAAVMEKADPNEYAGGVKIWGAGQLKDLTPGTKFGKGVQHLNSAYWIEDLSAFIAAHLPLLQAHLRHIEHASPEYQFRYLLNQSNVMFIHAEKHGIRGRAGKEEFLLASWLAMAAAEVDDYNFSRYTPEQRAELKQNFFSAYLAEPLAAPADAPAAPTGGRLVAAPARVDLLPKVALERVGINNELSQMRLGKNADLWLREGFAISKRIDSLKRHLDESHKMEREEDAMSHLIWNFMAIYHVALLFPAMNDIPNYEDLAQTPALPG
jgi:hypothetical protein